MAPQGVRVADARDRAVAKGEPSIRLYDTSGPQDHDVKHGLPKLREPWVNARLRSAKASAERLGTGAASTQLHYARKGEITPEMEFIAIREGLPADFVRDEVARGRAIIPSNINHLELEPMIIGRNFLVKINANIGNSAVSSSIEEEVAKLQLGDAVGRRHGDGSLDRQEHPRDARVDRAQLGRCRSARCRSTRRSKRSAAGPEDLTWEIYRDTLIEQCEQGVDYFTVHAGVLLRYIPMTARRVDRHRLARRIDHGQVVPRASPGELHLHALPRDLRDHARLRRVVLARRRPAPGSIADANDEPQFAELKTQGELNQDRVGVRRPGDERRPRPRPHAPHQREHGEAARVVQAKRRSTRSGRSPPTSRPATTTSPRRSAPR